MLFDERGLLSPPEVLTLSVAEFEKLFVNQFPNSATRHSIFASYRRFADDFSREVCSAFTHWIDGSFVTDKLNPNDMDFVVHIKQEVYVTKELLIESTFRLAGAKRVYSDLDVYAVRSYPADDPKRYLTEHDLAYWYDWFTHTRLNRTGKRNRKGFVEIIYS